MKITKFISLTIFFIAAYQFVGLAQPVINFPEGAGYDWGKVKPGQNPLTGKILIRNIGKDTLKISRVQPSCGCTSAPLTKYSLLPNETTELMVTLNISSYEGNIEKYIDVYSNDPTSPQKRLTLMANIERLIKVEPSSFVSFMQMTVGESQTQSIQIKNYSNRDVEVSIKDFSPKDLRLSWQTARTLKKGESYPLEISINAQNPGIIKGKITVTTDDPDFPEVPIFIFGDVKPSPIFIGN